MQPDYGLDYEVEIVEKEKPTGKVFGVQLKGTRSPKYEDESLRLSFEVDKLIYYFEDICKPVFIVVAAGALFLVSDRASAIIGVALSIDGGFLAV